MSPPRLTAEEFMRLYGHTNLELVDGVVAGLPATDHSAASSSPVAAVTGQEVVLRITDGTVNDLRAAAGWLRAGLRRFVILDPAARLVTVYSADGPPTVLKEADALEVPDVLPGFSVSVGRLFGPAAGGTA